MGVRFMSVRRELPLDLFRKLMCGVVALLSICVTSARAGIVFQDNFNRVGALNGSTPSITLGGTWTAPDGFNTDGEKVNAGPFGFSNFLSAAYVSMPVAITSGNIYTLSATMSRGLSTDDTAIMIFGFFDAAPSWNGGTSVDNGNAIAIAPRNNLPAVQTMLNGSVSPPDIPVADGTNGVTYGIRLYETSPNAWSAVAVELSPTSQVISFAPTPISIANIKTIGLISGSLLPPYIDNLTLDVSRVSGSPVPEPSTFVLASAGLAGLVTLRKKLLRA
jgi:PEP-CTERM motif